MGKSYEKPSPEELKHVQIITKYAFLRASHQKHNNKMGFKDMRDWLIDGGHKMYKIPVTN